RIITPKFVQNVSGASKEPTESKLIVVGHACIATLLDWRRFKTQCTIKIANFINWNKVDPIGRLEVNGKVIAFSLVPLPFSPSRIADHVKVEARFIYVPSSCFHLYAPEPSFCILNDQIISRVHTNGLEYTITTLDESCNCSCLTDCTLVDKLLLPIKESHGFLPFSYDGIVKAGSGSVVGSLGSSNPHLNLTLPRSLTYLSIGTNSACNAPTRYPTLNS